MDTLKILCRDKIFYSILQNYIPFNNSIWENPFYKIMCLNNYLVLWQELGSFHKIEQTLGKVIEWASQMARQTPDSQKFLGLVPSLLLQHSKWATVSARQPGLVDSCHNENRNKKEEKNCEILFIWLEKLHWVETTVLNSAWFACGYGLKAYKRYVYWNR